MVNPATGPRAHQLRAGGGGHRAARLERPQPAEHPRSAPPRAGASARRSSRRPGCADRLGADYSQIELRIMAHLSGDQGLLARLRARRGRAPRHRRGSVRHARRPGDERAAALRQGDQLRPDLRHERLRAGAATSASSAPPRRAYIDTYFARYPGVAATWSDTRAEARERGYVETVFGRRLWLPEISVGRTGRGARRAERAGDQRADAGHGRRPDQARDDRGAGLDRARGPRRRSW